MPAWFLCECHHCTKIVYKLSYKESTFFFFLYVVASKTDVERFSSCLITTSVFGGCLLVMS